MEKIKDSDLQSSRVSYRSKKPNPDTVHRFKQVRKVEGYKSVFSMEEDNQSQNGESFGGTHHEEVRYFVDQMSEKYIAQLREDRHASDQKQIKELNSLLKDWADKVVSTTKDIVSSIQQSNNEPSALDSIADDIKERQLRMITTIQEAHDRQMEILKTAISEERKESAQAQLVFEQTLKTRYECMVDALHDKVRAEQEARMQRALDNLERSARIESERAKQSFEVQQEAEVTLSRKFKSIVSDLRKSWEEEEVGRAMQLEARLRSHYSVVLEHMEGQLRMALALQDDADKQWLEDVEARNRQQLETLRAFEEKCRRLYDTRLGEFAEKTTQQISQYEDQLLEAGKTLAAEKAQFESRLRRIKLGCSRWKLAYQKEVHERYADLTVALEDRYAAEVQKLLREISESSAALAEANRAVEQKEREIATAREAMAAESGYTGSVSPTVVREELVVRWNELKVPAAERVEALVNLLDASRATPQMLSVYEALNSKLSARQPIAQLINRKQYIEYKLKLASRIGGEGSNLSASDRAQLISELTDIQNSADQLVRQYERQFGESYFRHQVSTQPASAAASHQPESLSVLASPPGPYSAVPASPSAPTAHKYQQGTLGTKSMSSPQPSFTTRKSVA